MAQDEETEPNEENEDIYMELDPRKVAGDLMDYLVNRCDAGFECMPLPDEEDALYRVLDHCLGSSGCDIEPEVEEAIKKSKTFRDELEKELREMLNDFWAFELSNPSYGLGGVLDQVYNKIVNNKDLVDFRNARLLKNIKRC